MTLETVQYYLLWYFGIAGAMTVAIMVTYVIAIIKIIKSIK